MELNLKGVSQYSIFHPDTMRSDEVEKFILVSDHDEWNSQYRNIDGFTGVQHDGAPRSYMSMSEADDAARQIIEMGNPYLTGIYQCGVTGYRGKLVHNFRPPLKDTVEGYADAGSW